MNAKQILLAEEALMVQLVDHYNKKPIEVTKLKELLKELYETTTLLENYIIEGDITEEIQKDIF